jgi:dCMP deaminase
MKVADDLGARSLCCRAQVGAVIVTDDQRAVSPSYNGPAKGDPVAGSCSEWCPRAQTGDLGSDYGACRAIHAEANALTRANYSEIQGATIYITGSICINCAKIVANSGITRVVHRVLPEHEYRNPGEVEAYLRECGIEVVRSNR